jgi:hypothetical protein
MPPVVPPSSSRNGIRARYVIAADGKKILEETL